MTDNTTKEVIVPSIQTMNDVKESSTKTAELIISDASNF